MGSRIEKVKVWLLVRLLWRSPRRRLTSLRLFSATEADSAWQLASILNSIRKPTQRVEVFEQILEEMNHAELFADQVRQQSTEAFIPVQKERQALYPCEQDTWRFFAYCIVGEKAALDRFSNIARALPASPLRDVFRRILRDEAGHVHDAEEAAQDGRTTAEAIRQEISRVKRRRFKEAWLRQGQKITDVVATLFLSAVYYVVAPFGYLAARNKVFGYRDSVKNPVANLAARTNP